MAKGSVLEYACQRQYDPNPSVWNRLVRDRFSSATDLYRKDLFAHYGCVNAIEFSLDGDWLVSGKHHQLIRRLRLSRAEIRFATRCYSRQRGRKGRTRSSHHRRIHLEGVGWYQNRHSLTAHAAQYLHSVKALTHRCVKFCTSGCSL